MREEFIMETVAIPTWAWVFKSTTLAFLKKRRAAVETFRDYVDQRTKPKNRNIDRILRVVKR